MPIFNVDVTADPHRARVVGPDHAPVPSINDFLSYLEQCARSSYTVRAYARGLAHFAGWLYEAGVDLDAVTPSSPGPLHPLSGWRTGMAPELADGADSLSADERDF